MANDRFGVKWGLAGGTALATIAEAREMAKFAEDAKFDSFWISNATAVDPLVALATVAECAPNVAELGTSVVPLYGRHPIVLAQQALSVQSALGGRFTLGVGAGSKSLAEGKMGLSWDKPFSYTQEFMDAMLPLLHGQAVEFSGAQLTANSELTVTAEPPPVLLAALGPRMLRYAGAQMAGTTLGQCGPRTIASHVVPHLDQGAQSSGRARPRIMALVRICVTDDHAGALSLARKISAWYQASPSYARVIEKEGLAEPAELHLIGSWAKVLDGLAAYAEAGATDLRIEVAAHNDAAKEATREALANYLS